MLGIHEILQAIDRLAPEDLQQVREHIEQRQKETDELRQPFILDLHPGAMIASDDFDDPLPDEFWLGEE